MKQKYFTKIHIHSFNLGLSFGNLAIVVDFLSVEKLAQKQLSLNSKISLWIFKRSLMSLKKSRYSSIGKKFVEADGSFLLILGEFSPSSSS